MLTASNIRSANCKPTLPSGKETTSIKPSLDNSNTTQPYNTHHTDSTLIPTSTENMSTEMSTLSASDISLDRLDGFNRLANNIKAGTDSLFNDMKSSEESTHYISSLSSYPSIPNYVKENVKNCTHVQDAFQTIFDLVYSYQRRMNPIEDYIFNRYHSQGSMIENVLDIKQNIMSLMLKMSEYVAIVPVTDTPSPPLEYITVLETLATLSVQSQTTSELFIQLKQCTNV